TQPAVYRGNAVGLCGLRCGEWGAGAVRLVALKGFKPTTRYLELDRRSCYGKNIESSKKCSQILCSFDTRS
ncbi:hypothetical protein, partial [Rhizobium leguminosarum]|uniref:hypothetical protein n=1 Tax=Rhizobium leguminosarum TaxID=384 RepID=UPI001AEC62C2